jgi:hypothetical protein
MSRALPFVLFHLFDPSGSFIRLIHDLVLTTHLERRFNPHFILFDSIAIAKVISLEKDWQKLGADSERIGGLVQKGHNANARLSINPLFQH